jgi:hypothetical protein
MNGDYLQSSPRGDEVDDLKIGGSRSLSYNTGLSYLIWTSPPDAATLARSRMVCGARQKSMYEV